MRLVLSGGGTAGHINPALALAEVLQERGHEVLFAGTPQGVEARLVVEAGIPFTAFKATGFNRNHPTTIVSALMNMVESTQKAKHWLAEVKPDVVVGFGGYVCIPVGRAAGKMGIPLVVHEQNSVMGLANKFLAKRAQAVAVTYRESAAGLALAEKLVVTGNPVRKSVLAANRKQGRAFLNIPESALVLLVFGGSLGARHINEALLGLKEHLMAYENLYIVHLSGPKDYEKVHSGLSLDACDEKRWKLFSYQNHMGEVLAAADIVLARAGATSLAEISARKIPALLVPFPYATKDHQTTNARAYVERGAASMVPDDALDSEAFLEALSSLIEEPGVRRGMQVAAAGFESEDAASRLADVVITATRK